MSLRSWATGRSEEEYKQDSIYKDDTKVEELKTDMKSLSVSVEAAKTAVSDAIEKLNNVHGVERIGSFNVGPINKSFDQLNEAVTNMSEAIVNKAESINEYSKATGGEVILASALGAGVSLLTGALGAVEQPIDGALSLVGMGLNLLGFEGAANKIGDLVKVDGSGYLSHKYYNSELGQKCAWTEDSGIARGLEFVGEVGVSMAVGGGIANMAGKSLAKGSASKLANLALKANTSKHYIAAFSALEGMGSTTENRLRAGDTFQQASKKGLKTAAITGVATYGVLGALGKAAGPSSNDLTPVKTRGGKLKLKGDPASFWGTNADDVAEEVTEKGGKAADKADNVFTKIKNKFTGASDDLTPVSKKGKLSLKGNADDFWKNRAKDADDVIEEATEKGGKAAGKTPVHKDLPNNTKFKLGGAADDVAEEATEKGGKAAAKADEVFEEAAERGGKATGKGAASTADDVVEEATERGGRTAAKADEVFEEAAEKGGKAGAKGATDDVVEEAAERGGKATGKGTAGKADEVFEEAAEKGGKTPVHQQTPKNTTFEGKPKHLEKPTPAGTADDVSRNAGGAMEKSGAQHAPAKQGGAPASANDSAFAQKNMSDDDFMKRLSSVDEANRKAGGALDPSGVQHAPASSAGAPTGPGDSAFGLKNNVFKLGGSAEEAVEEAVTKPGLLKGAREAIQWGAENPTVAGAAIAVPAAFRARNVHPDYDLENIDPLNIDTGEGSGEPGTQEPEETTIEPTATGNPDPGPDPGPGGGGGGGSDPGPDPQPRTTEQPTTTEPSTTEPSTTEPSTTEVPTTEEPAPPTDVTPTEITTEPEPTPEPPQPTTEPVDPGAGGYVPGDEPYHQGGGYSDDTGYSADGIPEVTEDASIIDGTTGEPEEFDDASDSIDSIIKGGSKVTKIPSSKSEISSGSSGSAVIPVIAGLSAAAAAGIGAKAYMDRKNNNDNGEDEDFEAEEWTGEDNLDIDYNDGVQEEQYLDDDSDYGTTEESEEKYDARTNDELADLQ